jgi:hypothetical protein
MPKIPSPFTMVACPVCGEQIDCKVDTSPLIGHINEKHPEAPIKQLIQALFHELNSIVPDNIDEVDNEELKELLANMCLYKATRSGLDELRRRIWGK